MKSILDKMGITPNAMQQDAMHALLRSDKDVVVLSPTGSGKTLAYLLPLTQLVDAGDDMPQAARIARVCSSRPESPSLNIYQTHR